MRDAFAKALRDTRKAHGFTQEDLAEVSSRTYVSILERGQKNPTLNKMNDIAEAMGIHLMSLIALTYLNHKHGSDLDALLDKVRAEVKHIQKNSLHDPAHITRVPSLLDSEIIPDAEG